MSDFPVKIHIIRRGSGQVKVEPTTVHVKAGFSVANHTDLEAMVTFDHGVTPASQTVPAHQMKPFTAGEGPDYTEYDVVITGGFKADGNSRPGAIIDP